MEAYIINVIVLGVISWTTAFLLVRRIFPKRSFDFCNRAVSTIHATLAVILTFLSVQDWGCPVCPLAAKSSPKQRVSLDNSIHHLVSIVGIGAGLAYEKCGSELVAALWVTEVSSPFLHLRELLKELGFRDTDLNLAVDILFAVIFTLGRMVCGPYITYVTVSASNPFVIKAMALGLQLVSAFWFYKIVRMVTHKLTKRTASKNVSSKLFTPKI
ncbi:hypothetical protein F2P56_025399 [Juglans regia]|uniref:TLC domain-containing protein 5-like isoform X2 n=2 Tax=Juglans regia TaxID=51240 RepID=A0A2I4ENS5_JUGRE|nr:TLC domain-containing protein 5-like isoform X2 [Juglans regia]KAF5455865.1 hypothetical protein F2P56_025399 [Juglans regia]